MNIKPNTIDLDNRVLDLKDASVREFNHQLETWQKEQARVVAKEVKQEVKSQAAAGWHIKLGSIALRDDSLRFDNDNETRTKSGIDYAHIKADGLTLEVKDLLLSPDSIAGSITRESLKNKAALS